MSDQVTIDANGIALLNPDDIRAGDTLATGRHDHVIQSRGEVVATDVIAEMRVDGEQKLTAGVEVRTGRHGRIRQISYEYLADIDFRVWRDASALTDDELAAVRAGREGEL